MGEHSRAQETPVDWAVYVAVAAAVAGVVCLVRLIRRGR